MALNKREFRRSLLFGLGAVVMGITPFGGLLAQESVPKHEESVEQAAGAPIWRERNTIKIKNEVSYLAFAADGKTMATCGLKGDPTAKIWDMKTNKVRTTLEEARTPKGYR